MKRLIGCIAAIGAVALVIGIGVYFTLGASPAKKLMKEQPYTFSEIDKNIGKEKQESYVKDGGCVFTAYPETGNKATDSALKQYVDDALALLDTHLTELEKTDSDLIPRLVVDYSTEIWENATGIRIFYELTDIGEGENQTISAGKNYFYLDAESNLLDLNGLLGEESDQKIAQMLKAYNRSFDDITAFQLSEDTLNLYWADGQEQLSVSAIRRAGVIDPDKPMIALTFDDGPGRYSRDFADLLTRYGARGTFFVLGMNVENFAEDLKYVYEQGNEIASHTMRHKNLNLLSTAEIQKEIDQAANAIHDAIGVYPTLVRTPYGNANDKVMNVINGPMIKWSVDTLDWKTRDAQSVKNEIIKGADDGEIILLHEIYESSLDGLEMALKELSAEGYQFVTVSELMQYRGVTPECKHYYSIEKE